MKAGDEEIKKREESCRAFWERDGGQQGKGGCTSGFVTGRGEL